MKHPLLHPQSLLKWIELGYLKTCFLYAMGHNEIEGYFNGSEKSPSQPTLGF